MSEEDKAADEAFAKAMAGYKGGAPKDDDDTAADDAFAKAMSNGRPQVEPSQSKPPAQQQKGTGSQVIDTANAIGTGGIKGLTRLLASPVDAVANVIDLGKAALGAPYQAVTGKVPPDWLLLGNRADVVGSGDYLINKAKNVSSNAVAAHVPGYSKFLEMADSIGVPRPDGLIRSMMTPINPDYEGGYSEMLGGALAGGVMRPQSWKQAAGMATGAVGSGALGKLAYDTTGNPAWAAVASLSPYAAPDMAAKAMQLTAGRKIDPLAAKAINEYGIPLTVADITKSNFVKSAKSLLDDLPLTEAMGRGQKEAKHRGFNAANARVLGSDAEKLGPLEMLGAKDRIGNEFNKVWGNNDLFVGPQYFRDVRAIANRASRDLTPDQQLIVRNQIEDLLHPISPNGRIAGDYVNNWQSTLRGKAELAKGETGKVLHDLRNATIQAFNRGITGQEAKDLATARKQYKAYKTLEPAMNKAEAGVAGRESGDVPAGLLPGRAATQYGSYLHKSPFADLAPIAGRYMVDRTPRMGGTMRAMQQNALTAAVPWSLGTMGALTMLPYLLGPGMARSMVNPNRTALSPEMAGSAAGALTANDFFNADTR